MPDKTEVISGHQSCLCTAWRLVAHVFSHAVLHRRSTEAPHREGGGSCGPNETPQSFYAVGRGGRGGGGGGVVVVVLEGWWDGGVMTDG
jgi:hypothetical protein